MTRRTSAEAYYEIKANGLLSKRRFEVYEELYLGGPGTQTEVVHRIWAKRAHGLRRPGQPSFTPRFRELLKRGVIVEVCERPCKITGRNCIEWETTTNLPLTVAARRKREFWIGMDPWGRLKAFETEEQARKHYVGEGSMFVDSEIQIIRTVEKRR